MKVTITCRFEALYYKTRSRVRVPIGLLNFLNLPNPSIRTMALGLTQSLTEISTKNRK
jgi:hypothetical protein